MIGPPAANPCGSCPYRRDVPSGVWARKEYLKLPAYDRETALQPHGVFLCHQKTGSVCAGWCGTHDMPENLAIRLAGSMGMASTETVDAILDYSTETPLFASGREACEHGLAEIKEPGLRAQAVMANLARKRREKKL